MTTSACPSSRLITAVSRSKTTFCSALWNAPTMPSGWSPDRTALTAAASRENISWVVMSDSRMYSWMFSSR